MRNEVVISGIQQVGLGIPDLNEAFRWYNNYLGFDAKIFDDEGVAELMLPYTGGKPQERRAILAINMRGGGGLEIWQPKGRTQRKPENPLMLGDLGFFVAKYKSGDIAKSYAELREKGAALLSDIVTSPVGVKSFFLRDPFGNLIQIEADDYRFHDPAKNIGGVHGLIIGVSDMERSLTFYREVLGYDTIINDTTGVFGDFAALPGGAHRVRRVSVKRSEKPQGAFSPIFGTSVLELVQALDYIPVKIFQDRWWGDAGYIHICFDINGMKVLQERCESLGHPFVCDSNDRFDMGEAAGHFSYVEDPDGALIEFVETHKVPVIKKLGWYVNLQKRSPKKPLPLWMLKAIGLKREKL
ncbi:MAG: glyoxalase [Bacteroidetes bacterium]|nr:MAG: glyoxalase [Bacteroidota bacterium]PIE88236.1 MAG: glyoxalase [Bacteroidota bacterium]